MYVIYNSIYWYMAIWSSIYDFHPNPLPRSTPETSGQQKSQQLTPDDHEALIIDLFFFAKKQRATVK